MCLTSWSVYSFVYWLWGRCPRENSLRRDMPALGCLFAKSKDFSMCVREYLWDVDDGRMWCHASRWKGVQSVMVCSSVCLVWIESEPGYYSLVISLTISSTTSSTISPIDKTIWIRQELFFRTRLPFWPNSKAPFYEFHFTKPFSFVRSPWYDYS